VNAAVAAIVFSLSGCGGSDGPRLYNVNGTLKVKGNPAPNVRIQLHPIEGKNKLGIIASGVTDSNGHFNVNSPGGRGAANGSYKVVLATAGPMTEAQAAQVAKDKIELSKKLQEASKKMAGSKKSAGPSQEVLRNAAGRPGGMEAIRNEMEAKAKGRNTEMDKVVAASNTASATFPAEYASAVTSPKEVEVKDQALKIDLDL
jgi:5-hydroxyisourate hydrolase-like protein (transthyretin family)